jgi:hypothetical protein
MALFSLTDIKFKTSSAVNKVPIISDIYRRNTLRYPEDIGEVDKGHYMVIHINVQDRTSYRNFTKAPDSQKPTIFKNRQGIASSERTGFSQNVGGLVQDINDLISNNTGTKNITGGKIQENLQNEIVKNNQFFSTVSGFFGGVLSDFSKRAGSLNNANFVRPIVRTTDTIALYMPDTLLFEQKQYYENLELGEEIGAMLASGSSILKNFKDAKQLGTNVSPFIANALKEQLGKAVGPNTATAAFYSLYGTVNPKMEMIYSKPDFRSFSFEFMFYPRNEKEAIEVQRIIQKLKFHQAPELDKGTAGFFLVPPSEFDIEFYYNGYVNPNIPKISTCVLTGIQLDYAPNGFTAYESPDTLGIPVTGKTGMPVAIRMRLDFSETEIMTKYNFEEPIIVDDTNELRARR